MSDRFVLPPPSGPVNVARPPAYALLSVKDTPATSKALTALSNLHPSIADRNTGLLNHVRETHNASPQSENFLLGIPDRSSSASAPPDLEISSQSLFAFKAGYSGIFSDIRMDEHYESFYNENPDRGKLPPPISASALNATRPPLHPSKPSFLASSPPRPPNQSPPPGSVSAPHAPAAAPAAVRPPISSSHFYVRSQSQPHASSPLRRDDSSTSFDDLIYREASTLRPVSESASALSSTPVSSRSTNHLPYDKLAALSLDGRSSPPPPQPDALPPRRQQSQQTPVTPVFPVHHYDVVHGRYPYHYSQSPSPHHAAVAAAAGRSVLQGDWSHNRHLDVSSVKPFDPVDSMGSYPTTPIGGPDMYASLDDPMFSYTHTSQTPHAYSNNHSAGAVSPVSSVPPVVQHDARAMYSSTLDHEDPVSALSSASLDSASAGHYHPPLTGYSPTSPLPLYNLTADYLNAQAAAAAAAAAAAVYESNGVHINPCSSLPGVTPIPSLPPVTSTIPKHTYHRSFQRPDIRRSNALPANDTRPIGRPGALNNALSRPINDRSMERNGIIHAPPTSSLDGILGGNGGSIVDGTNGIGMLKFSSFDDVVGRAEELARDQHGCRFLQTKLEEKNEVHINCIFEECYEKFVDLMTDPFGNYLCQKLFELCSNDQKLALVKHCAPAMAHVSTNMHGTRAVQRIIECLSAEEQVRTVCNALKPAAVELMKDINGNHVIQRCLQRMEPVHNQFVYDAVANKCFELATHRHGCCVMQRCMDYASPSQRNQLAQQINTRALALVQNPFGNYVVQYVLDLNDPVYTSDIVRRLRGHLADLSVQKFSSNVVEKSLQLAARDTRRLLIDELISDEATMRRLLHDPYGNYVIQRVLQVAEGSQLDRICEAIRPHLPSLKQSPYGKRIQAKIMKRMPRAIANLPSM